MKNNNIKGYAILSIFFVLVSVIAFAVPTVKTNTFWIAYVFTTVAFVVQILIWKFTFGKEDTLKSKFLTIPVVYIGSVYLLTQVIAFAVFKFIPMLPSWVAVVVCALIVSISVVCMIAAETGRGKIEHVETKIQKRVFYVKELQVDIEMLADGETDDAVKKELIQLAEKIRFSDPMSSEQLAELENRISDKVIELKTTADRMAIIKELNSLLDERNKKCIILK